METVTPFLMFQDGNAEEAMNFYTSIFEDSQITNIVRYGANEVGPEGTVKQATFTLKHGVKGAEFENILVVFGRGWSMYNFSQMLEYALNGIPSGKINTFERNRNLFYVACSRPKKRLALLFTQELTKHAIETLSNWFGNDALHSLQLK
jgi:superfamily I DNA/RNA helicase